MTAPVRVLRGGGVELALVEGEVLGWGSEAVVYGPSALPALAAKVYHAPRAEHGRKLEAMLAAPPADLGYPAFTWPVELLRGGAGEIAGYLMPRIPAGAVPLAELWAPRTRRTHVPAFTYRELVRAARSLAACVGAVHRSGHVVGDLDEGDLLAGPDARVTLLDTDSFQVRSPATGELFRCTMAQPDLTPPELHGIRPAEVDRAPEHDRFGLAVLLFQLLMEGTHPFAGVCAARGASPSRAQRIRAGEFAYDPGGPSRPAPLAPPIELLDPGMRALFERCFVAGHHRPASRPSAEEWLGALARAEAELRACDANPRHVYGPHLSACPWCERGRILPAGDPFGLGDDTLLSAPDGAVRGPRTTRVASKLRKPRAHSDPVPVSAPPAVLPLAEHVPPPLPPVPAPEPEAAEAPVRAAVNPFAGLALLLAAAGVVPALRPVAWGLALLSAAAAFGFASGRGGAGRIQLAAAAGIVVLTLVAGPLMEPRASRTVAVAPAADPPRSEAPRPEPPASDAPGSEAPPKRAPRTAPEKATRATPKAEPRRAPTPRAAPKPKPRETPRTRPSPAASRTEPPTRSRAVPPPGPRRAPEVATRSTRRTAAERAPTRPRRAPVEAPEPPPRRTSPPAATPSARELAEIRGDLAVAQVLKNQGAYTDAGATLRGAQRSVASLSARYPGSAAVAELDQRVRALAAENRRACQAEAAIFRSRGEPAPPCP